ncbi:hypothetical protein ACQ1QE_05895 [Ornithobacterium rhinotracheale]
MNTLKFDNTGGFPLDTNVLDFMQSSYKLFNSLGYLAGDLAIISGCEVTGSTVKDGTVFIKGELLPFKGGSASATVVIREEKKKLPFEDGVSKEVEIMRYATFGAGSNAHNWADFKRFKPLPVLQAEKEDKTTVTALAEKITKLEKLLKNTIPIGLVAIWDRPANEIPAGWVEHTDLRGRVPAGQGTGNFATLGAEIGEGEHTLTENELPAHKHAPNNIFNNFITFGNKIGNGYTVSGDTNDKGGYVEYALGIGNQRRYNQRDTEEKSVGQGQAFNVVQPTRIVKFIRFVGFD